MLNEHEVIKLMDKYLGLLEDVSPHEYAPGRVAVNSAISTLLNILEVKDLEAYEKYKRERRDQAMLHQFSRGKNKLFKE